MFFWFLPVVAGLVWLASLFVRGYALKIGLLDVPNRRSSHTIPTPKGGGIAIVGVFLASLGGMTWGGAIDSVLFLAAAPAGALVAVIGFLDDRKHIPAGIRLLVHVAAACWLLFCFHQDLPAEHGLGRGVVLLFDSCVVIGTVWVLNLFNFMDGINGIATLEAIFMALAGAVLVLLGGSQATLPLFLLAACCLGFLPWNFPAAKLFLGDAGSGFLGYLLSVLALFSLRENSGLLIGWLILGAVFLVDATVTLLVRVVRGERFYQAHRSHAYQIAALRFASHAKVTGAVLLINLFWLLPLAVLAVLQPRSSVVAFVVAYAPLVLAAIKSGAGIDRNALL